MNCKYQVYTITGELSTLYKQLVFFTEDENEALRKYSEIIDKQSEFGYFELYSKLMKNIELNKQESDIYKNRFDNNLSALRLSIKIPLNNQYEPSITNFYYVEEPETQLSYIEEGLPVDKNLIPYYKAELSRTYLEVKNKYGHKTAINEFKKIQNKSNDLYLTNLEVPIQDILYSQEPNSVVDYYRNFYETYMTDNNEPKRELNIYNSLSRLVPKDLKKVYFTDTVNNIKFIDDVLYIPYNFNNIELFKKALFTKNIVDNKQYPYSYDYVMQNFEKLLKKDNKLNEEFNNIKFNLSDIIAFKYYKYPDLLPYSKTKDLSYYYSVVNNTENFNKTKRYKNGFPLYNYRPNMFENINTNKLYTLFDIYKIPYDSNFYKKTKDFYDKINKIRIIDSKNYPKLLSEKLNNQYRYKINDTNYILRDIQDFNDYNFDSYIKLWILNDMTNNSYLNKKEISEIDVRDKELRESFKEAMEIIEITKPITTQVTYTQTKKETPKLSSNGFKNDTIRLKIIDSILDKIKSLDKSIKIEKMSNNEILEKFGEDLTNKSGFVSNNIIYINTDFANVTTPLHELLHIYLGVYKNLRKDDYNVLLKTLKDYNINHFTEISNKYSNFDEDIINEEFIVSMFDKIFTLDYLRNIPEQSNEFLSFIDEINQNMFKSDFTIHDSIIGIISSIKNDLLFNRGELFESFNDFDYKLYKSVISNDKQVITEFDNIYKRELDNYTIDC